MRLEVDLEMYVRWQKQQRPYNRLYWAAQLVTIARVNGVPKQKHLAYLAGIAEDSERHCRSAPHILDQGNGGNSRRI